MSKFVWYLFVLILVYVLVVYYKGSSEIVKTGGGFIDKTILYLQGRNDQGQVAGYPQ